MQSKEGEGAGVAPTDGVVSASASASASLSARPLIHLWLRFRLRPAMQPTRRAAAHGVRFDALGADFHCCCHVGRKSRLAVRHVRCVQLSPSPFCDRYNAVEL